MDEIIKNIDTMLDEGVKRSVEGVDKVGIIFSGGIDSTLIALKAKKYCNVKCYNVGVGESPDRVFSRIASKMLDVHEIILDDEGLEQAIIDVVNLVKDSNPLTVGVGVPMYMASKIAAHEGIDIMLCGQGADELFGGYWRYVDSYVEHGPQSVIDWMKKDVENADEDNLDRDRLVTSANKIELRMPFLTDKQIEYMLDLPLEFRLKEVDESFSEYECVDEKDGRFFIRKYILRKVAEINDVPYEIINRRKKAAQYGSSVHKNMERLARKNGMKAKALELGEKSYLKLYLASLLK